MDHNFEDSLNMESIESMDFDHSAVVVNQADISIEESNHESSIPMDLDTIEEQPSLLGTGHEEVIVSDFMGEQFSFQEFAMQEDNSTGANITIDANQIHQLLAKNENPDLQYSENASKPTTTSQNNIITIKALQQQRAKKSPSSATFPRQVAIAPKPSKVSANVQYAIAPKPVAFVVNRDNVAKTQVLKSVAQDKLKRNTVLAQIGKHLVMMPSSAVGQKIKLTSILQPSGSTDSSIQLVKCSPEQAQVIANKGIAKPIRTKFIVHGTNQGPKVSESSEGSQTSKLVAGAAGGAGAGGGRSTYVMQQKTVPITIAQKKMLMTSPPKLAPKGGQKKQLISIKSHSPNATSQANVTTKKVVITANPSSNIVINPSATKTVTAQAVKTSNVQNQRTHMLHPINVPGKGIQLIKLVTNQSTAQKSQLALPAKNFVLTDGKGNIIQMAADKVITGQPPPLIVTSTSAVVASNAKVTPKAKRLVRIAPLSQKGATTTLTPARSSQSLLAPFEITPTTVSIEQFNDIIDQSDIQSTIEPVQTAVDIEGVDVKPSLLPAAMEPDIHDMDMHEVVIECDAGNIKRELYSEDNSNCMKEESHNDEADENVIIVPASFNTQPEDDSCQENSNISTGDNQHSENVEESEVLRLLSPNDSQNYIQSSFSDNKCEAPESRARKACNCTKSQCLKLYCDCFANGEFCHGCNCNNCLNNLDHEELRQKAIRACLERNPNAFRPKIGKGKTGGPEIIRRHNKGCNCKRSGCLKNYCECYEAKIACTLMCKCVGCRNVQETLERRRLAARARDDDDNAKYRPAPAVGTVRQPCSFITAEVIEAVAQCMLAAAGEGAPADPVEDVLVEFSRCMADIISAAL